jgi:hypothetical protein
MKHATAKWGLRRLLVPGIGVILAVLLGGGGKAEAAQPGDCHRQLILELTPDVPNPSDVGFLSSLLSNHPGYQLIFLRQRDDSTILAELVGPGPDYLCRNVVRTMRRDGRILSVHLSQSSS